MTTKSRANAQKAINKILNVDKKKRPRIIDDFYRNLKVIDDAKTAAHGERGINSGTTVIKIFVSFIKNNLQSTLAIKSWSRKAYPLTKTTIDSLYVGGHVNCILLTN